MALRFLLGIGRFRNHIQGFIGQDDFAVQRQADALAEQHLGEGEPVVGLGEQHLGLVGFDFHLKGVGFGGNAGSDGFFHLGEHFLQEVAVTLGQFLFVGDGDNLPVGLVYIQYHVGIFHVVLALGEVFCQGGHLVGIDNLTTHEHRLLHGDGPSPDVVEVGMKGLVDVGSDGIHGVGDVGHEPGEGRGIHSLEHAQDGLPHGAAHILDGQGRIGLYGRHQLRHLLLHGGAYLLGGSCHGGIQLSLYQRAGICQELALRVADEGDVAVII